MKYWYQKSNQLLSRLMFIGKQYGRADEAIAHYSSIFKNVKVDGISLRCK